MLLHVYNERRPAGRGDLVSLLHCVVRHCSKILKLNLQRVLLYY